MIIFTKDTSLSVIYQEANALLFTDYVWDMWVHLPSAILTYRCQLKHHLRMRIVPRGICNVGPLVPNMLRQTQNQTISHIWFVWSSSIIYWPTIYPTDQPEYKRDQYLSIYHKVLWYIAIPKWYSNQNFYAKCLSNHAHDSFFVLCPVYKLEGNRTMLVPSSLVGNGVHKESCDS